MTNSVTCMQVNYLKCIFLKEFERIRRPGEDSFEITDHSVPPFHSGQKTCQFRSNCGLKVRLAGY